MAQKKEKPIKSNKFKSWFTKTDGFRWWVMLVIALLTFLVGLFGDDIIENKSMTIEDSSNSIFTIDQSGGNNTIINSLDIPEPKVTGQYIETNEPDGEVFRTKFRIDIESETSLKNLYVQVQVDGLIEMSISNVPMSYTGEGENWAYKLIPNPYYDSYVVTLKTENIIMNADDISITIIPNLVVSED